MNKNIVYGMVMASALILTTSGCRDHKHTTEAEAQTAEKADTTEAQATVAEVQVLKPEQDAKADEGYPSTYEQPKGKVLELLKDYNAHMDDYNTSGVTALGMGFQCNRVLLNYTVDTYLYDLNDKAKLKAQASELIKALPMGQKVAWRCIPEEGHDLMMTFVGKQSRKIVSVVFTCKELKDLL